MNKEKMILVGTVAAVVALGGAPAAVASSTLNTGVLLATTPVGSVGASGDSVVGSCAATPAGGDLNSVNYVLSATAQASSTGLDVAAATGVTCRIWDTHAGVWLSNAVSGAEPGTTAAAAGQVTINTNLTSPVLCVYANALFTPSNTAATNHSATPCPSHS